MLRNYSYYTSPGRILQSGFYRGNYPGDRQLYCWAYANYKRNNHVYFNLRFTDYFRTVQLYLQHGSSGNFRRNTSNFTSRTKRTANTASSHSNRFINYLEYCQSDNSRNFSGGTICNADNSSYRSKRSSSNFRRDFWNCNRAEWNYHFYNWRLFRELAAGLGGHKVHFFWNLAGYQVSVYGCN